jgi:hypothetical protein
MPSGFVRPSHRIRISDGWSDTAAGPSSTVYRTCLPWTSLIFQPRYSPIEIGMHARITITPINASTGAAMIQGDQLMTPTALSANRMPVNVQSRINLTLAVRCISTAQKIEQRQNQSRCNCNDPAVCASPCPGRHHIDHLLVRYASTLSRSVVPSAVSYQMTSIK